MSSNRANRTLCTGELLIVCDWAKVTTSKPNVTNSRQNARSMSKDGQNNSSESIAASDMPKRGKDESDYSR